MKKILIVDDSKTNRATIEYMLDDWCEDNDVELLIKEAEDGLKAVELCQSTHFDLIFMDIMMPNMNGIDATKEIRQIAKKDTMIVAVSALDDDESKNKILQNGAEDYITKPINEDIFRKRINNYLSLIESRKHKKFNAEAINVIDNKIYSRRLTFIVKNDLTLSEFWDYFLLEDNSKYRDKLTDLIRVLYGLGLLQIKLKFNFEISVEESDDALFFTMNNIKLLNQNIVERIISKNYTLGEHKIEDDKVTFKFLKFANEKVSTEQPIVKEEKVVETTDVKIEETSKEVLIEKSEDELQVFDFLDPDDLEELESIAHELQSMMMLVGSSRLEDSEVIQIANYIAGFSKILTTYNETYAISSALSTLSKDIEENVATFQEKSKEIGMLCESFNKDLLTWLNKLFYNGAPSIDFLDSSIISNANMISNFITPANTQEEELDDIFDF